MKTEPDSDTAYRFLSTRYHRLMVCNPIKEGNNHVSLMQPSTANTMPVLAYHAHAFWYARPNHPS